LHDSSLVKKRYFNHQTHDAFVQLDELQTEGELEWQETARWIKYEENLEDGSDRWGRPHVSFLSFQSLLKLRSCLETGVVILDLEEKDLAGTANKTVEQMVVEDLIHKDDRAAVMRVLMLRHRHVNSYGGFHFGRRKNSSHGSLIVSQ
jgi:solute carrier family 4 anion exchanger 2